MNRRLLKAICESCERFFDESIPVTNVKQIRASVSNRDIWAQTHCDTTGHTRFVFVDSTHTTRIIGRSNQMSLHEDPDIDLKDLA